MICLAGAPTLPEWAETYYSLRLIGASRKTLELYRQAVTHWRRVHPELPLDRIDRLTVAQFQQALSLGRSPATVNGYLRPIMAMLRLAADEDFGLLERAPKIRRLKEPIRTPLALTVEEFRQVLAWVRSLGGTVAGYPAPDWWMAVLLTAWETGLRFRALLALRSVDLVWESGGLFTQAEAAKDREAAWFSLQGPTLEAIRLVYDPTRDLLFPLDVRLGAVGKRFRRILDASGIYAPKGSGMRFHRLRRSKASYTELAGGDAQRALGHSARFVTERYLDPRIVGQATQPPMPMPW